MNRAVSVRARLARVLSAQIYNQVATLALQLVLVPLLLHAWGTERYGVWLILSAVPTYLTLSDFGFTFIAKNVMVMQVAAGAHNEARRTFQSIFVLLIIAAPILFVVILSLVWTLDISRLLSIGSVPTFEARIVLSLLLGNILMYQLSLLISAGIRCENRAAAEASWSASARLGEGVAIALAVLAGGSPAAVAAATVANRITFNAASYRWMRRHTPWLKFGLLHADRGEIRRLLYPALGYMLIPMSQALLIQGPVLVLGTLADPKQVAVFSTSRTLARIGTAATNMLNNTLTTEYSARAGLGDQFGFARLFRQHLGTSVLLIFAYSSVLLLLCKPIMHFFTSGKITVVEPFFMILMGAVALEMLWTVLFTPISAINRHISVTHWLFIISLAAIALCWLFARGSGLAGVAAALVVAHGLIVVVCTTLGRAGRIDGRRSAKPASNLFEVAT